MRRPLLWTLLPLLAAAALGFGGLGRWTLWQDEAFTWLLEQRDLAGIIDGAAQDRHPPLYYLIVAAFYPLGDRDWILRLPSALAYVGAVVVTGYVGMRRINRFVGQTAALIVALSPAALLYAWTARMYAMLLLCGAVLLASGVGLAVSRRPVRYAVAYGLALAAAMWIHYAAVASIVATGLGTVAAILVAPGLSRGWARGRGRAGRIGLLVGVGVLAGLSFLPWALGPLQFQLSSKDAPSERTWTVLAYAFWAFDTRVPPLSLALVGLQLAGIGVALRRRGPVMVALLCVAVVAVLLPWLMSSSGPAQNPRNYVGLLPAGALLAALTLDAIRRRLPARFAVAEGLRAEVGAAVVIAALAAEPLVDLCLRTTSPQEPGIGFDYQLEADVLDASVPVNGGLYFRPSYLIHQYRRYAPALEPRTHRPVDSRAWLAVSRADWVDASVTARYRPECTFARGFREIIYAPEGPGCDAANVWLREIAAAEDYVPFLQELARRALDAGELESAEGYARREVAASRAMAAPHLTLAEVLVRKGDGAGALAAAEDALSVARTWHLGGGLIGEAHAMRARALQLLGRTEEAGAARAAVVCARRQQFPTACGEAWEPLVARFAAAESPPPNLPPLPAVSESQRPEVPARPPAGAERLLSWPFEGEVLPEGWVDVGGSGAEPGAEMVAVDGQVALVVAGGNGRVGLACGPLVEATSHMVVRARWKFDASADSRTIADLEVRMVDGAGRVMKVAGSPLVERPLRIAKATGWRVDRFDFRAASTAAQVRLCFKVDGEQAARLVVDWLELGTVPS